MATAQSTAGTCGSAQPVRGKQATRAAAAETARRRQALVPVPRPRWSEDGELEFSAPMARLPVELDVAVPVREFRVRHLLALAPGQVIESQWGHGDDLAAGRGRRAAGVERVRSGGNPAGGAGHAAGLNERWGEAEEWQAQRRRGEQR